MKIENLTGDFNQDEQNLIDYTIQKIQFKKKVFKIQVLILVALIFIFSLLGFYLFKYALDEKGLKQEYGINYYCYKCGYISGKSCSCNYMPDMALDSREQYFLDLGSRNAANCDKKDDSPFILDSLK